MKQSCKQFYQKSKLDIVQVSFLPLLEVYNRQIIYFIHSSFTAVRRALRHDYICPFWDILIHFNLYIFLAYPLISVALFAYLYINYFRYH